MINSFQEYENNYIHNHFPNNESKHEESNKVSIKNKNFSMLNT